MDASPHTPFATPEPPGTTRGAVTSQDGPEVDLDRLVWDPEYRRLMRSHLKDAS